MTASVVVWLQAAMDVLEEMREAGLAMDAFTYAHAIEACCTSGNRVNHGAFVFSFSRRKPFFIVVGTSCNR